MQHFAIKTDGQRDIVCKVVQKMPLPFDVTIEPHKSKRSAAQNRLLWRWYSEISAQYLVEGKRLSKDEWHHLCAMKFLGVKIIEIGGKAYPMPLKSTTELKVGEFSEYLLEIESEFLPKGVVLTFPDDYGLAMGEK